MNVIIDFDPLTNGCFAGPIHKVDELERHLSSERRLLI